MSINEFIILAKRYNDLGWWLQKQLVDVANGDLDDCNPNTLRELRKFLRYAARFDIEGAEELIEDIDEHLTK